MKTVWIVAFLVAFCSVCAQGQFDDDDYDSYNINYDELEELVKGFDDETNENTNKKTDSENDLTVAEEIQQFRDAIDNKIDAIDDPKDTVDNINDYQFEDNRDKSKEEEDNENKDLPVDNDGHFGDFIEETIDDNHENRPEPDNPNDPSQNKDYVLLSGDDNVAPLPVPEAAEEDENKAIIEETRQILADLDNDSLEDEIMKEIEDIKLDETVEGDENIAINSVGTAEEDKNKAIIDETKQILAEDADNFEDDIKSESDEQTEEKPSLEKIVEETEQLLAESDDSFSDDDINVERDAIELDNLDDKVNTNQEHIGNNEDQEEEEDTVDKAYEDLNADLDKLFETLDKLTNDDSDNNNHDEDIEKALEDADKFFEELDTKNRDGSEELTDNNKYEDVDLEKLLESIMSEDDMKAEDSAAEVLDTMINDAINEPNPDDANELDVETLKSSSTLDTSDDSDDKINNNAETVENSDEAKANDASIETQTVKTALVDELNSAELEELVAQFSILHREDLEDLEDKEVAPVHITLKLDEPTVIESPNYPDPYPTNNIVDWVLEGNGEGIELNITAFAVNGALGDYLLIKPGGIDETGYDGLLFTYRLSSERRYRFTDVDRLFMRFESKVGEEAFNGFSISAKMIAPLASDPEPVPEPEAVVTPPHSTATVTLALPVPEFKEIEENFRQVVADMAEEYIRDNNIEAGQNTTSEVTQITSVSLCPMTWPGYEGCSAVTFGVSLAYEDESQEPRLDEDDLTSMWVTYVNRDPFALRLRSMGVSEFNGPNSAAMTAWLVIAGAVIISMSILAFVLWRYSCFEGYTRMKPFSDTDSVYNEKRNLDLYPTPHQTLPPLYADSQAQDYKWTEDDTRVDMGGFANRSYTRENMYDFDSDEDVIPTRDRQGVVDTKDYSNV